jgi:hypothetical protein
MKMMMYLPPHIAAAVDVVVVVAVVPQKGCRCHRCH